MLGPEHQIIVLRELPGGVTQVKTYVNMCVQKVIKWTHISEVDDRRIAPFSEPLPLGHTLNSEFNP